MKAHRDAQQLRRDEKLIEARARLVTCAGARCPGMVEKDCSKWLDEVASSIPSIVISAKDEGGHELTDVSVSVEDHFKDRAVDGSPIELDPGAYRFVYTRPGGQKVARDVVLQNGVRNRLVEVTFPGGKLVKKRPPPPAVAYVLAGVGAVAFGSFAYFGLKGRSEYLDLEHSCAPQCPPSDGDPARRDLTIADVSLAISAVSLAGSAYFVWWWPSKHEQVVVAVSPLGGSVGGRF